MGPDEVTVRCYSGYTYAERPQSFTWRGTEYEVTQVVREWLELGAKCFLVATGGNKLFQLCYNETEKQWSLTELVGG